MASRILVVDDEKDIIGFLSELLKGKGYEVHTAHDGYSAMEAIRTHKPDLVVMDFAMPAGSGADVYNSMRALTAFEKTPVIFLSALPKYQIMQMVPEDPGIRFLEKPLNVADFQDCLAELLPAQASGPAAEPGAPPA